MLKESIKSPIFTDGFRLIDLLCQSYPHTVWSWALRMAPEKFWPRATDRETCYVWKVSSRAFTRTKPHVRSPTGRWDIAHEVPTDPKKLATMCVRERVCVLEIFCAGFESLLLDRCSRQSLIILRLFWVFAARQVFASEHSGVSLLCTWSILYTVMETLEDGIHCEDCWRKFEWFVTRIESIIWSIFTVKVIDYRFRFLLSLWST